jgi:proteasome lid subunit RPN8/RPN11
MLDNMSSLDFIIPIRKHILTSYPNEACGIVLYDNFVIPLENISEEPTKSFKISSVDITKYIGNIKYIYHSHCRSINSPEIFDLRTPSFSDILGQQKSGIPWLIFGTEGTGVTEPLTIPRVKNNNYLQRPFIWYINDCYSLVQDYYQFEFGIILDNHKAKADYKDIRKLNNIFGEYIEEYGFIKYNVKGHKFQDGDLVLLDSHGFEKNHLGIYEDGFILHQDTLSKKEKIEHFIDRIHLVLRHASKSI